jgi:hypothetical protein
MKMIASRELSARPGAVWEMLSEDGKFVGGHVVMFAIYRGG